MHSYRIWLSSMKLSLIGMKHLNFRFRCSNITVLNNALQILVLISHGLFFPSNFVLAAFKEWIIISCLVLYLTFFSLIKTMNLSLTVAYNVLLRTLPVWVALFSTLAFSALAIATYFIYYVDLRWVWWSSCYKLSYIVCNCWIFVQFLIVPFPD